MFLLASKGLCKDPLCSRLARSMRNAFRVCSITQKEKQKFEPQFETRVPTIYKRLPTSKNDQILITSTLKFQHCFRKQRSKLHLDPNVCPSSKALDDLDVSWIISDLKNFLRKELIWS